MVVLAHHATGNLVSAAMYKEFLLPFHKELTSAVPGPFVSFTFGICRDRLELFAEAGFDAYHFEWQVDARFAKEKVGARMCLVGCSRPPPGPLPGRSPRMSTSRHDMPSRPGSISSGPNVAVPLATPLENLKAIVEACREGY